MSEWLDSQKNYSGKLGKMLVGRVVKSNPRRKLTAEEA